MTEIYSVLYINTEEPGCSEVYDVYSSKEEAVNGLLKCVGYWVNKDGQVRLNDEIISENTWKHIQDNVYTYSELRCVDIFRIEEHKLV